MSDQPFGDYLNNNRRQFITVPRVGMAVLCGAAIAALLWPRGMEGRLHPGMSREDVVAALGAPYHIGETTVIFRYGHKDGRDKLLTVALDPGGVIGGYVVVETTDLREMEEKRLLPLFDHSLSDISQGATFECFYANGIRCYKVLKVQRF
jgi:hypothetical protein